MTTPIERASEAVREDADRLVRAYIGRAAAMLGFDEPLSNWTPQTQATVFHAALQELALRLLGYIDRDHLGADLPSPIRLDLSNLQPWIRVLLETHAWEVQDARIQVLPRAVLDEMGMRSEKDVNDLLLHIRTAGLTAHYVTASESPPTGM